MRNLEPIAARPETMHLGLVPSAFDSWTPQSCYEHLVLPNRNLFTAHVAALIELVEIFGPRCRQGRTLHSD